MIAGVIVLPQQVPVAAPFGASGANPTLYSERGEGVPIVGMSRAAKTQSAKAMIGEFGLVIVLPVRSFLPLTMGFAILPSV